MCLLLGPEEENREGGGRRGGEGSLSNKWAAGQLTHSFRQKFINELRQSSWTWHDSLCNAEWAFASPLISSRKDLPARTGYLGFRESSDGSTAGPLRLVLEPSDIVLVTAHGMVKRLQADLFRSVKPSGPCPDPQRGVYSTRTTHLFFDLLWCVVCLSEKACRMVSDTKRRRAELFLDE